jgi:hypothetical protein
VSVVESQFTVMSFQVADGIASVVAEAEVVVPSLAPSLQATVRYPVEERRT